MFASIVNSVAVISQLTKLVKRLSIRARIAYTPVLVSTQ